MCMNMIAMALEYNTQEASKNLAYAAAAGSGPFKALHHADGSTRAIDGSGATGALG
jgi:hypothetical protein